MAEGTRSTPPPFRRSRARLNDLGYFNTVNITSSPGSSADRAIVTAAVDEKATGELSLGGGFSTDAGALLSAGLRERNLVGTGIDANLSGVLAQRRSEVDFSLTDPYFLDQNLVGGFDLFHVQNNNQNISAYNERRTGRALRLGYEISDHLRQALSYSIVDRNVFNVNTNASLYIQNQQGGSLLSQVGQTLTLDYRDSRTAPHAGFVVNLRPRLRRLGRHRALRAKQGGRGVLHSPRALHWRQRLGYRAIPAGPATCSTWAVRKTSSTASSSAATISAASSPAGPGRTPSRSALAA